MEGELLENTIDVFFKKNKLLIETFKFKDVIKELENDETMTEAVKLVIKVKIASKVKENNDFKLSYSILQNVYSKLSKPEYLGEQHEDVVNIKYQMAMSTDDISETYRLLQDVIEISEKNNYKKINSIATDSMKLFLENIPKSHSRLYKKIKKNIKNSEKTKVNKKQHLTESEIDDLMVKYGL
jgi:hypothetical protein